MEQLYIIDNITYLYFYQGRLSNFSKVSFDAPINKVWYTFNCGEQYIMARKARLMNDKTSFNAIMKCKIPKIIKSLGRKVTPWNQELWNETIHDVAYQLCLHRCMQDGSLTELGKYLVDIRRECKKLIIVEASQTDCIWGSGQNAANSHATMLANGKYLGTNILGFSFMKIIDDLCIE